MFYLCIHIYIYICVYVCKVAVVVVLILIKLSKKIKIYIIDPENHSHVVNTDFIEFYGSYPDVYLSPADQQGNRIIKMINYSDLHKRIKRSRWGPACVPVPRTYIYTRRTAFLFFNLVVQLYSAAITEFVQGPRNENVS